MPQTPARILIVDDNALNLELLEQTLSDAGYEVDKAVDGSQALARVFSGAEFQLVLLDVMMPGLTGLEVCARLRRDPRSAELPIIMVTAKADASDVVTGLKTGANDYVTKPIDTDILLARVETHLNLRALRLRERQMAERMQRELEAARTVQESLLPDSQRLSQLNGAYGVEIAAFWQPCDMLGGDFWDVLSLADGSLGLFMADFPGHGVVPSLNTFRMKTFLQTSCSGIYNAGLAMTRIHAYLSGILEAGEPAACCYAHYHPDRHQLTFCGAGSPFPLVHYAGRGEIAPMRAVNAAAGIYPGAAFEEASALLEPGDKVLFHTDGVTGCRNAMAEPFGEERLRQAFRANANMSPRDIVLAIRRATDQFCGGPQRKEDMTIVAMEVAS